MADAHRDALAKVPLFAELGERELKLLSGQMHERRFPEGAQVTLEGSHGAGFFVIAEGNASVSVGGEPRAFTSLLMERAGDDEGVRSASITAVTDLLCYGMTPWEFRPFVEQHPQVAWGLLQTLARRFRGEQTHQDSHSD